MQLTQELTELRDLVFGSLPEEMAALLRSQIDAATEVAGGVLGPGAVAPAFTLPDIDGRRVVLADLLAQGPVVLAFFRGGWCHFCSLELKALERARTELAARGASLVAVSPQTAETSTKTAADNGLGFPVLVDAGNEVARSFGLVFTVPDQLRAVMVNIDMDLTVLNGDERFELPIPATYVIGSDGVIAHAHADADYTRRSDPEELCAVLDRLAASKAG